MRLNDPIARSTKECATVDVFCDCSLHRHAWSCPRILKTALLSGPADLSSIPHCSELDEPGFSPEARSQLAFVALF